MSLNELRRPGCLRNTTRTPTKVMGSSDPLPCTLPFSPQMSTSKNSLDRLPAYPYPPSFTFTRHSEYHILSPTCSIVCGPPFPTGHFNPILISPVFRALLGLSQALHKYLLSEKRKKKPQCMATKHPLFHRSKFIHSLTAFIW